MSEPATAHGPTTVWFAVAADRHAMLGERADPLADVLGETLAIPPTEASPKLFCFCRGKGVELSQIPCLLR